MSAILERLEAVARAVKANADTDMNAVLSFDAAAIVGSAPQDESLPLAGQAVAVKDNICTRDYPTTCGSRILDGYRSPYDATAVSRIRRAGGTIACKTNLDEFAMGSSTEHSAFGRTLHPIDRDRVPGGSSGGSAALVAAGVVDMALGSETGGSVRQPAAFCGVVGIKPSYGRVSRYGLVAFGSSLDQIGILGRSVADASRLLSVVSGHDPLDSTSMDMGPTNDISSPENLDGWSIGIPAEYFSDQLDDGVRVACDKAVACLKDAGATIKDVSMPHTALAIPTYYVIAPAEASSNLARYDGVRYGNRVDADDLGGMYLATRGAGFGSEVKRRIIVGTYVLSSGYYDAYYGRAQRARGLIAADFSNVFSSGVDLLFTPTTPTTAFKAGEKLDDPVAMYLADIFTATANLAGVPAMNIPIGMHEGLPVGGQFIAPQFREERMMEAAMLLESRLDRDDEVA